MNEWAMVAGNLGAAAVMFGGIAACVRFDQRGKTRRREVEHVERMRAIELGQKLDDAAVARSKALGAIGVAVPIVSLSSAVIGGCFALTIREPEWRFGALAAIWAAGAAVCVAALPAVAARLRESQPGTGGPDARHD